MALAPGFKTFSAVRTKVRQSFSWLSAEIFGDDQVVVGNVKLSAQGSSRL